MIATIIADDEALARHRLREHLERTDWIRVVAECGDGMGTIAAVDTLRPDLLFLDVRMPGFTGIEVLQRIQHKPAVVFTTAYDRYAVTAFELQAVDYLLKPFGRKRLEATLERIRTSIGRADRLDGANRAVNALDVNARPARVFVRQRGRIIPIALDDVTRFEACDDYVMIHTNKGRRLASVRLCDLERQLGPGRFLRIHRSHIVNVDHVRTFESHSSGRILVTMQDGVQLFASRSRSQELRQRAI